MAIVKRTSVPKKVKSLTAIRVRQAKKEEELFQYRRKLGLTLEPLDIKTTLRAFRGEFGSGYNHGPGTRTNLNSLPVAVRPSKRNRLITDERSAIAAVCYTCHGNTSPAENRQRVADCDIIECPLWAFRLGMATLSDKS